MTIQQLQQEFEQLIYDTVKEAKAFGIAVATIHTDINERVFEDGVDANGVKIGEYSENAGWFARPGSRDRKFYPGGYREFKADIGKESSFVNLELSGNLKMDFSTGLRKVSPLKYQIAVSQQVNAEIIEKMEHKYSTPIFEASEAEQDKLIRLIYENTDI